MLIIITGFVSSLLLVPLLASDNTPGLNTTCTLTDGENGTCVFIYACPMALERLKLNDFKYVKTIICGFSFNSSLVCCPNADSSIKFKDIDSTTAETASHIITTATAITSELTTVFTEQEQNEKVNTEDNVDALRNDFNASPVPSLSTCNKSSNLSVTDIKNVEASELSSLLPNRSICGTIKALDMRIFGGDLANIDEFPWIVRIKYQIRGQQKFACAGTLISDRYVLTAAHCLDDRYKILGVRLGEWDTQTEKDCFEGRCNDPAVDIKIEESIKHPRFDKKFLSRADIALLRMEIPVNFTDFIRPICLPATSSEVNTGSASDTLYLTAGWGKTESSNEPRQLRKVQLKGVAPDICQAAHNELLNEDVPYLICAGGRKGQDSCSGDSGGSLVKSVNQNDRPNWFIHGITSYGLSECGSEGIPSLYTRVAPYLTWILDNIRP